MPLTHCPDCDSEHLQAPCGMTWIQRIRSQHVDPQWMPTRSKANYYDADAVTDIFGDHATDQYMDETEGRGAVKAYEVLRDPTLGDPYLAGDECDDVV